MFRLRMFQLCNDMGPVSAGWEPSQRRFLGDARQLLLHRLDSWMSQSPQASFHRGQHSCGMRPDGDSRVITHLGLHLEGLSKDNRLWTELFFFFNEVGKEREEDGEKL